MCHLKNIILIIIKKNNWNISDKIKITSCITTYFFENNVLSYLDSELDCNTLCEWENCPVCNYNNLL
jgi:hypothetical protein